MSLKLVHISSVLHSNELIYLVQQLIGCLTLNLVDFNKYQLKTRKDEKE